jgi:hypothetical protein
MIPSKVRRNMTINGIKVHQSVLTFVPRTINGHYAGTTPAYAVTLVNGRTAYYELGADVPAVGYADPLPGGLTQSKLANNATRVSRASDGKWAGQSDRLAGMSTYETDLVTRTNMYDVGRVNGVVGATR